MGLRERLAKVTARDHRFSVEAYEFVFVALDRAKERDRSARVEFEAMDKDRDGDDSCQVPGHVSARTLCEAARDLALEHYGLLALMILECWGLRSTSDLGDVVYHLIAAGALAESPEDSRADFDNLYDFETDLRHTDLISFDD